MRVAYVQFQPVLGDPGANREAMRRLLARTAGTELVVLPELANSGYNFADAEEAAATAEPAEGETCAVLAEACREHGFHVVCGLNESAAGRRYNSAILVGPNGLQGLYRKSHLFAREKHFFAPGDLGIPTFQVGGLTLGILICFDWAFPESWTSLLYGGADVVALPSNLVLPGKAQRAAPVMAMMHRFFVVTANRVGVERDLRFTGGSLVADPSGSVLASASEDGEEVACVAIDPREARDKWMTPHNHLLRDRRPELLEALAKRAAEASSEPGRG